MDGFDGRDIGFTPEDELSDKEFNDIIGADFNENSSDVSQAETPDITEQSPVSPVNADKKFNVKKAGNTTRSDFSRFNAEQEVIKREIEDYEIINGEKPSEEQIKEIQDRVSNLSDEELSEESGYAFDHDFREFFNEDTHTEPNNTKTSEETITHEDYSKEFGYQSNFDVRTKEETVETVKAEEVKDEGIFSGEMTFKEQESGSDIKTRTFDEGVDGYKEVVNNAPEEAGNGYREDTTTSSDEVIHHYEGNTVSHDPEEAVNAYKENINSTSDKVVNSYTEDNTVNTPEEAVNTYKEDIIPESVENTGSYRYAEKSSEEDTAYNNTSAHDTYSDNIAGEAHTFDEHTVEYGKEFQDASNPFVARHDGADEPVFYDVPRENAGDVNATEYHNASDIPDSNTPEPVYERVSDADIERLYQEKNIHYAEKSDMPFDAGYKPSQENSAPSQTYLDGLNDRIRPESNIITPPEEGGSVEHRSGHYQNLNAFYAENPGVMQAHSSFESGGNGRVSQGRTDLADGENEEKAKKSNETIDLHNKKESAPVKEDIKLSKDERRSEEQKTRDFAIKDEKARERFEEKLAGKMKSVVKTAEAIITSGSEEDSAFTAKNKLENFGYIVGANPSQFIGDIGAVGAMKVARNTGNAVNIASGKADKLIAEGVIKPEDLTKNRGELKDLLKERGVNSFNASQIAKYRKEINNASVVKTELKSAIDNGSISLSASDKKAAEKLFDKNFSDLYKSGKAVNNLTNKYFAKSPDELLKKVGVSNDIKGLKSFLKKAEETDKLLKKGAISDKDLTNRIHLSEKDKTMLKNKITALKMQKDKAGGKALTGIRGGTNKLSKGVGILIRAMSQQNDVAITGAKKVGAIVRTGTAGVKGSAKILKKTGQLWWRKSLGAKAVRFVGKKAGQALKKGVKTLKTKAVQTKPMQAVIQTKNNAIKQLKLAKEALGKTKGGKALKAVSKGVKKTGRGVKKVFGFTNRVGQIVFAPINFMNKIVGAVRRFLRKILFKVLALLAIILIPVIAISLIGMFFTTTLSSFGTTVAGITEGTVALTDEAAHASIEGLTDIARTTKEEAVYVSKRTPTEKGSNGITLYQYGNPESVTDPNKDIYHNNVGGETTNGIDLIFYDSNKNPVGSNTNNIKDAMSIAAVMLGNDFNTQESVDTYTALSSEIMRVLNPACTFKVSDIYHMPEGYSSDKFPYTDEPRHGTLYYCTDDGFYQNYDTALSNGVVFFQTPQPHTERGCRINTAAYESAWKSYIAACQAISSANASLPEGGTPLSYPEAPDITDYYYCPGHPYLDADFGYRKIKVFTIVLTKDDVYKAFRNSEDPLKAEIPYYVPLNYECTEWEQKSVTFDVTQWSDKITDFNAEGGYTNQVTVSDEVLSDVDKAAEVKMTSYLDGTSYWTNKQIEWTQEIYNGDWVANYGVDPATQDLGGAGLATGAVMTSEQIKSITAQISYDGGIIGEKQKEMVEWGLSKVGGVYSQDLSLRMSGLDGHIYDCSSFAYWACQKVGITLGSDTSAEEAQWLESVDCLVTDGTLKPGDLIFYSFEHNNRHNNISHVEIYIGNNTVVHASSSTVGIITSEYSTGGLIEICRPLKLLNL